MPQVKPVLKIRAGACYFAFVSRDIHEIAAHFHVNTRTVRRWSEEPEWDAMLEVCRYTGDHSFENKPRRDTVRDGGCEFDAARAAYLQFIADGVPKHRLASATEQAVGIDARKIRRWAKRFNWRGAATD